MLSAQAKMWRCLMAIGMSIHRLAHPRPPSYTFRRRIESHFSSQAGSFLLYFYCPLSWRHRSPDTTYPVVINFHGGGFTIGHACDDARWADAVVSQVEAVVVSVHYRLAPEYPFPTAVKDGVEAVLYLSENAEELGLDTDKFAISGFSAGGNMAFSVPLRLQAEVQASQRGANADTSSVYSGRAFEGEITQKVKAIVAWYPSVNFTIPRTEREKIPKRPDLMMPKFFTDLFDASYLNPPTLDCTSPYLSPAVAPAELLRGLPDTIMIYPCEYDGLGVEAEVFRTRLETEIGKRVRWREVEGVPHGWDKSPNPFRLPVGLDEYYRDACDALRVVFGKEERGEVSLSPAREVGVDEAKVREDKDEEVEGL